MRDNRVKVQKRRSFKTANIQILLLSLLMLVLSACGSESASPTPASTTLPATAPASTSPSPVTPTRAIATSGIGSGSTRAAATPTPLPVTPTALSSAAPVGTLAVVQDGKLLLVKAEGGSAKEIADLGADLSDKLSLRWSPDGNRFLLNEANQKLTLIELDSKRTPLLELDLKVEMVGAVSWSSDNKHLAFERIPVADRGRETRSEIWVADLTDPTKPALNRVADGFAPAFSPDGRNLAYATYGRDVSQEGQVFNNTINLISVDGKQSRQVLDVDQLPEYRSPDGQVFDLKPTLFTSVSWSPDGRTLTFHDGRNFIGTVATTGGRVKVWWYNTAKEAGQLSRPGWSSRNDHLAFTFTPDSAKKARVLLVEAQSKTFQLPGDNITCSVWSPDGSLLAAGNGKDLNIVRASDRQIYGTTKTGGCPVWSPEGAWLGLSQDSGPEAGKGLLILRPDCSNIQTVANLAATRQLRIIGWKK